MSLDFTKITNFSIPQGNVSSFTQEGITFWNKIPTLEEASWEFISEVSRAGKAQEYWYVGDTKTISIGGETYKAIIISFDHYYPATGYYDDTDYVPHYFGNIENHVYYPREKLGITFMVMGIHSLTRTSNLGSFGGFRCPALGLQPEAMYNVYESGFEPELKNVIYPASISKNYLYSGADNFELYCHTESNNDNGGFYTFALSYAEVFGAETYTNRSLGLDEGTNPEGNQHQLFYANIDNALNFSEPYWLRTLADGSIFYVIDPSKSVSIIANGITDYYQDIGTPAIFCV